jgi:hypothetical protein
MIRVSKPLSAAERQKLPPIRRTEDRAPGSGSFPVVKLDAGEVERQLMLIRVRALVVRRLGDALWRSVLAAPSPWDQLRAMLEPLGVLPSIRNLHHGPPRPLATCLDHVTAAPRIGPPAEAAAVSIALLDRTGGAVIVV